MYSEMSGSLVGMLCNACHLSPFQISHSTDGTNGDEGNGEGGSGEGDSGGGESRGDDGGDGSTLAQ